MTELECCIGGREDARLARRKRKRTGLTSTWKGDVPENPFTAADKDEIERSLGYILEINGDLVHDAREEAIASLLHLCEIWMRVAIERARLGMERLMSIEHDRAGASTPRRELSQVELAALEWLASDWKRATARHANR